MNESSKNISNTRRLPAGRLMFSYLAVIMAMSIIFSTVFYVTSVHELDKRPSSDIGISQPKDADHELDEWIGRRSDDSKGTLAIRLVTLNLVALFVGTFFSYWLSRRTLRPIEKALDEQDQFIADASHELRTPITSALLSNEVALKNKKLTLLQAKEIIEGNVKDMQELKELSDELLLQSHSVDETVEYSEVNLKKVTEEAVTQVSNAAKNKTITINNKIASTTLKTDASRLQKVLVIVIDNAIKYSNKQTTITLTSKTNKQDIEISIQDQGIGIAKADIANIFDRFYRADTSRTKTTGYGLGLSIAKRILNEINGTITVTSTPDVGSTFSVKVPRNHHSK